MRIVGGRLRGRAISAPRPGDRTIRPTTDRMRETLFNMIAHNWPDRLEGARVIDLFAGTGALGFEALSRGASAALFVEPSVQGRALIRRTMEDLALNGVAKVFKRDATRLGPIGTMTPFDLAFADPPYGRGLGEKALAALRQGGWLRNEALVVLEEDADARLDLPEGFAVIERRAAGDTALHFIAARE
ncbi:MAG: 16S rRNA (guanine(966)-N(2))-methyltransferase RsmD [Roseitalea porphyridii]|jgi:16S rRNA (guanine966-N2)-methyltransferase|uniref:16S rRNA (guanine(966)-N(2))-methyltransferase RsmD n=1 Tax=Roseitalea porphyridii TaxID=1852022 RepID=UPI0007C35DED|nr:16S rRNA (guanine(966)-N(2))-methyltransferase RsmD [Leptolyngbya valderiana BDU 20041]